MVSHTRLGSGVVLALFVAVASTSLVVCNRNGRGPNLDGVSADDVVGKGPIGPPDNSGPPGTDDVLPPERRTIWQPGVTYNGGIPDRTSVCATLSPSGGDDTDRLQDTIRGCADNTVVRLNAGTFRISGNGLEIRRSNVTLRGAGPGEPGTGAGGTILRRTDTQGRAVITVWSERVDLRDAPASASADLAEDAIKGTDTVTLTRNPGVKRGEYVLVDHVTNNDPQVVWNGHGPGTGMRNWFCRQDRSLSQILQVKSVEGNKITFETKFHTNFRTQYKAQLARFVDGSNQYTFLERVGIENLHVTNGRGGDGNGNISVDTCAYCWVRNIESANNEGTAVGLYSTYRSEIRDSYIHDTAHPHPGGGGYMTGINFGASDNLIENNIIWRGNKMIVVRASGGGNVVAYNYMEDGYGGDYKDLPEVGLNAGHYSTPHMELLEGNLSFNMGGDSGFGNSIEITAFRNHLTGTRRNVGNLGLTDVKFRRVIALDRFQYNYNFLGNVLGAADMQLTGEYQREFVYEIPGGGAPDHNPVAMWELGLNGDNYDEPGDPKVAETALRHGNYDYVTKSIVWDPARKRELPPSLYLKSKPAFFGNLPWPWVTPEDAAKPVGVLPARERFDKMPH